jgi:hypothetical protein
MRRLTIAAALSASFLLAPALAFAAANDPNPVGVDDLGVDISGVALTPTSVHQFISSLSAEDRKSVEDACAFRDKYPTGANEQTLAFCADATKS